MATVTKVLDELAPDVRQLARRDGVPLVEETKRLVRECVRRLPRMLV
jgi:hypothetical protein